MPRSFLKNLSLLLTLNFVSADLSFAVDHPQLSGKSHAFMTEEALALFPIASVHRFKDPSSRLINDQLKGGNWSASDHGVAFFAVFIGSEIFAELARHGSTFAGSAAVGLFSFWGLPIAAAALAGIWVNHQNRVSAPSWLSRSGFSSLRDWRALQDWKKVATSSEAMGTIERWALRQNFRPERIFLSTSLPSGVLARTTGHGKPRR